MKTTTTRRQFIVSAGLGTVALSAGQSQAVTKRTVASGSFSFCLNTATIRGQKLGIVKEIEIAAQAGYDSIEPWASSLDEYAKQGGSLKDLRKRLDDLGLTVESAIAFSRWIVDNPDQRRQAFEQVKAEMGLLAEVGGKRIAAPPAGATRGDALDLMQAGQRYRSLLELGDRMGVVPQLEVWGASQNLSRLSQSVFVMIESAHAQACLLPDVYHLYKGGNDFAGLNLLSAKAIQVLHMNDYPADPPRETIGDKDRVYPGDGIAPIPDILKGIQSRGGHTVLSLELFSRVYWDQDPLVVAKTGLEKMKTQVSLIGQ